MKKKLVCKRVLLAVLAICMVLAGLASCKKKEDAGEYAGKVAIDCSKIWDHEADLSAEKKDYVPEDGLILAETEVRFDEGETAWDLLQRACEEQEIQLDAEDSAYGKYVKGIGQIYSGDCGDMSGWMFQVNGAYAEAGCDAYELQEGDVVTWIFICDYETDM